MKQKQNTPVIHPDVALIFQNYSPMVRNKLLYLRKLIYVVAQETPEVGLIEETIKWRQASYLTSQTKSGTTIRIDSIKTDKDQYAMYFHCQTTLIDTFKEIYKGEFNYQGNRSMIFHVNDKLSKEKLKDCIKMALTYHLNKK